MSLVRFRPGALLKAQWAEPSTDYRVTIWEHPAMEDVEPERIRWGEITFDLSDVQGVHEAIR